MIRRIATVAIFVYAGCLKRTGFHCKSDSQCFKGSDVGFCEKAGYCSFIDPTCPGGRRYGEFADALSQTCTGSADGGLADGGTLCVGCVDPQKGGPYNYVFVTSTTYVPGTLGTHAGMTASEFADRECQARAEEAGIGVNAQPPRHYRAWLSTSKSDALSVLGGATGWIRTDNRPFANQLISGEIFYPIRRDERGRDIGTLLTFGYVMVATGTQADGTHSSNTASDWTSTAADFETGDATATTNYWTDASANPAERMARLYCFGTDFQNPVTITKTNGRLAFVSNSPIDPAGGVGAANARCQSDAPADHLGRYRALLSTAKTTAVDGLDWKLAIWVRRDGIPWVEQPEDLMQGKVLTALNVDGIGAYRGYRRIWTGAQAPGSRSETSVQSCGDWTTSNNEGVTGQANYSSVNGFFMNGVTLPCTSQEAYVYCVEE
jgi:hypothetical protein